jgi:4-hydroxy-3-methylbut-2-en-1-yl diphosphate synthase IspG/GcpE
LLVSLAVIASGLFALGELVTGGVAWTSAIRVAISSAVDHAAEGVIDAVTEPVKTTSKSAPLVTTSPSRPPAHIDARLSVGLPASLTALVVFAILVAPLVRRCQLARLAARASSLRVMRCPSCGRRAAYLVRRVDDAWTCIMCAEQYDTRVAVVSDMAVAEIGG